MARITWNEQPLRAAVRSTFHEMALNFDIALKAAITEPSWPWPRGESPRDIVDTGDLLHSQSSVISDYSCKWLWTVPYAAYVHNGYVRGGTIFPARPWTQKAIAQRNPVREFEKLLRARL